MLPIGDYLFMVKMHIPMIYIYIRYLRYFVNNLDQQK